MNYLLAKIRGKGGAFSMVLSNQTVFDGIPDFTNSRPYDDEYKLREDEWFVVENFQDKPYCSDILRNDFDATAYSYLDSNLYKKIDYIVAIQENENGEQIFLFQNVTSSLLYSSQKFISFGPIQVDVAAVANTAQAALLSHDKILEIKKVPDCFYVKAEDKLYFKNLSSITSIFSGINALYNEATDAEVANLLNLPMINLRADFGVGNVKTANRRKIKEALAKYDSFSNERIQRLPTYIGRYCPALYDRESNKFNISNEKELTELLNGMNQRYYTTEIDEEKRLANSVTIVTV